MKKILVWGIFIIFLAIPFLSAPFSAEYGQAVTTKEVSAEEEKRLDQIAERKQQMKAERESLIRERDQLHEDVKNSGMIRSQAQLDAIKNRIKDLETRINKFNDDVKKLNEEEKKIVDGIKDK